MSVEIEINDISKRFKRDWIVRHFKHHFSPSNKIAVLGTNGSGKSTLLKIISGFVATTEGEIIWKLDGKPVDPANWHQHFAYSAPYLELIEEYTLEESLDFHFSLKAARKDLDLDQVLIDCGLQPHMTKRVSNFSSGMKQRLKLVLSLCSDVSVYLLDEPCSNLDDPGIEWYREMIKDLPTNKTIVVASNNKLEYEFCDIMVNVLKLG
ncbi:MAG: ABC-type multidrug transport system ATPase subunit [Bacteroidia bacterium]|jgi:ABC-type multidrug transport system ATPase subunit